MKKVWIIVIISIVLLAIGWITGIYIYNINNTLNQNSIKAKELADELKRKMIEEENRTVSTSSNTVKTSPNSIVQKNTVYKICNHTVQKTEIIPEELKQMTPQEIKAELGKGRECFEILAEGMDIDVGMQNRTKINREYER